MRSVEMNVVAFRTRRVQKGSAVARACAQVSDLNTALQSETTMLMWPSVEMSLTPPTPTRGLDVRAAAPSFQTSASHGKSRHSLLLLKSSPVPAASECVLGKVFDARGI